MLLQGKKDRKFNGEFRMALIKHLKVDIMLNMRILYIYDMVHFL